MSPNITRFGFLPKSSGAPAAARMGGFVLDMSQVIRRMNELNVAVMPAKIQKGLAAAGSRLLTDVVIVAPTVPIKRPGYPITSGRQAGELRASGALFVDGVKVRTTQAYGEMATGKYQPHSYGGTPIPPMSHEACVVFNAPYAAKQHEAFPLKSEPTAGTNYLGSKLYGNAMTYMGILAEAVRL